MELLNQTIGKYKLTKFLGEGGMANVYEGTHIFLGTKAAVKVLNPMLAKNEQFRQRFQNEAAFMATLDHPNITKVIDFENSDQGLAIVMELLEGSDLNDLIKNKGALTFDQFKPLFVQILDAFKYAHDKGIVHRDIKPSNIYILNNGQVKIFDFGIAKLFGQGNDMTQTGTQIGTPAFMSPEQVRSDKSIDHRSDIYSLGVTLYYALEGHAPYNTETESQFDIFNKIVFEPLPDLKRDTRYKNIIKKACEKDREKRFQDIESLVDALKVDNSALDKSIRTNKYQETTFSKKKYVSDTSEKTTSRPPIGNGLKFLSFLQIPLTLAFAIAYFISYAWWMDYYYDLNFSDSFMRLEVELIGVESFIYVCLSLILWFMIRQKVKLKVKPLFALLRLLFLIVILSWSAFQFFGIFHSWITEMEPVLYAPFISFELIFGIVLFSKVINQNK
jgi:serine/threonine protein kinase